MIDEELATITRLRNAGNHEGAYEHAMRLVGEFPTDVRAQMASAYACDRTDREHEAVTYYDTVYRMGIPEDEKAGFLLGYGSTLRNVGRMDEALEVLREASRLFPEDAAVLAFLAISLHSARRNDEAMATMIRAALMAARENGFGRFARALREYEEELAAFVQPASQT
ncbi:MAG: tetratricopeptide repeat protein [Deltaproteobacteria bacterium]